MPSREEIRRAFAPFLGLGTSFDDVLQGDFTRGALGAEEAQEELLRTGVLPQDTSPQIEQAILRSMEEGRRLQDELKVSREGREAIGGLEDELGRQLLAREGSAEEGQFIAFRDRNDKIQFRPVDRARRFESDIEGRPVFETDIAGKQIEGGNVTGADLTGALEGAARDRLQPSAALKEKLTASLKKLEKERGLKEEELIALRNALAEGVDPGSARFGLKIQREERETKLDSEARQEAQRYLREVRRLAKASADARGNSTAQRAIRAERKLLDKTLSERGRKVLGITEKGTGAGKGKDEPKGDPTKTTRFKEAEALDEPPLFAKALSAAGGLFEKGGLFGPDRRFVEGPAEPLPPFTPAQRPRGPGEEPLSLGLDELLGGQPRLGAPLTEAGAPFRAGAFRGEPEGDIASKIRSLLQQLADLGR